MPVSYERHGEAAVVTFDNPPLNVFGQAMRAGLQAAIARARAERPERLPRLIGMAAAVDLIGQGRSVTAAQALDLGLVDVLAEDPLAAALSLPQETLRRAIAADHRPAPLPDGAAITAAHAQANRRAAGQEAPHLAIDLVAAAATEPLDQALLRERATFIARRPSAQARALRHIFFAERAAASQGRAYPAPAPTPPNGPPPPPPPKRGGRPRGGGGGGGGRRPPRPPPRPPPPPRRGPFRRVWPGAG